MHTIKKYVGILLMTFFCVFGIESKALKTSTAPKTNVIKEIEQPKPFVNKKTPGSCAGSITVINQEYFCDGRKFKPNEETKRMVEQTQKNAENSAAYTERMTKKYPTTPKRITGSTITTKNHSGTVTVNGKSVQCTGSISVIDDEVFCNGKKILPKK